LYFYGASLAIITLMSYSNLRLSILLFIVLLVSQSLEAQDQAIPELSSTVTDLTATLSEQEKIQLSTELEAFADTKGSQVVVLIVPTTAPEDIAGYSIRVAEEWKIGREGIDDGIILLVAKNDRELRIEVGYGLEGAIPDIYAKRIIENIIVPNFRQGDFYNGIEEGVGAIMGLIEGEELPAITQVSSKGDNYKQSIFVTILLVVLFSISILKAFIKNKKIKWAVVSVVSQISSPSNSITSKVSFASAYSPSTVASYSTVYIPVS
jgi:uncharacterized protein